jgi:lysyl-tRNA synthetase class 2
MLELYTAHWDYTDTMRLTEETIRQVALSVFGTTRFTWQEVSFDVGPAFERLAYLEAVRRFVPGAENIELNWNDPPEVTREKLRAVCRPEKATTHEMIVDLFEERVEPQLLQPVFITEFAKAVSPLAKSKADDPTVAERFELYVCGMELANGYSELNDPREQYERFKQQVEARGRGDEEAHEMDEDYVRALEYGMPPTSGLGIGIDRLTMVLTGSPSIRDVILFPQMRPE